MLVLVLVLGLGLGLGLGSGSGLAHPDPNQEAHDDGRQPSLHEELAGMLFGRSCASEHGMRGHRSPEDACTAHVLDEVALTLTRT